MPPNAVRQATDTAISVLEGTDAVQGLAHSHPVAVLEQLMGVTYICIHADMEHVLMHMCMAMQHL